TGITGARTEIAGDLGDFIARVRGKTAVPLAVGFGISTPAQAAEVGQMADGVIVGSALIKAVDNAPDAEKTTAASAFVQSLREAMGKGGQ
ncbi:MAG: tryptophan synthase subunit alpha, partial [Anaerolineales bacterium]|nr:tryptophan synthase subunit alpha [Anaerolineales bacterium]